MPFVRCVYSGSKNLAHDLGRALSTATASATSRPEEYVCIDVVHSETLFFGGSDSPAAMVQVEAIGAIAPKVCEELTNVISSVCGIDKSRIFVNFSSFSANQWGMGGTMFG